MLIKKLITESKCGAMGIFNNLKLFGSGSNAKTFFEYFDIK